MTSSTLQDIEKIAEEIKTRQDEIFELSKKAFKEGLEQVFEAYPFLGAIRWVQYVPSFNDGDPCEFTQGEITLHTVGDIANEDEDGPEDYYESGEEFSSKSREYIYGEWNEAKRSYDESKNPDADPAYVEALKSVRAIFGALDDSFFEKTFGTHIAITIPREGDPQTTDYDCGY